MRRLHAKLKSYEVANAIVHQHCRGASRGRRRPRAGAGPTPTTAVVELARRAHRRAQAPPGDHCSSTCGARWTIRRLYRHERPTNPKGSGSSGSVGIRLWRLTDDERYSNLGSRRAVRARRGSPRRSARVGLPLGHADALSFYPGGSPNVVVTFFAARGLAEARILGTRSYPRAREEPPSGRWTSCTSRAGILRLSPLQRGP